MKLHLGVEDVPYNNPHKPNRTTGDVAEFLEKQYSPMGSFIGTEIDSIAVDLAEGFAQTVESIFSGAKIDDTDLFNRGTDKIEARFTNFIMANKLETLGVDGIPTKASEKRSDRERPSLVDTRLYLDNFRAWIDNQSQEN